MTSKFLLGLADDRVDPLIGWPRGRFQVELSQREVLRLLWQAGGGGQVGVIEGAEIMSESVGDVQDWSGIG